MTIVNKWRTYAPVTSDSGTPVADDVASIPASIATDATPNMFTQCLCCLELLALIKAHQHVIIVVLRPLVNAASTLTD